MGPGEQDVIAVERMAALTRYVRVLDVHLPQGPHYVGVRDQVLCRAAQQLMPAAEAWADQLQVPQEPAPPQQRGDESAAASRRAEELVAGSARRVAEEVAFDLDVPVHRLRARLVMVAGPVPWWQVWAPGVTVCTRSSLVDPRVAYRLLQVVFRSGATG